MLFLPCVQLFLMFQPEAVSASSEPQSGFCLSYDVISSRVLPSPLSPNAHGEVMGLNFI